MKAIYTCEPYSWLLVLDDSVTHVVDTHPASHKYGGHGTAMVLLFSASDNWLTVKWLWTTCQTPAMGQESEELIGSGEGALQSFLLTQLQRNQN